MRAFLESPDTFLVRYHRHHAGIMSWALGRGSVRGEFSSYDLMADMVVPDTPHMVLDLGCGDGLLLERLLARGLAAEKLIGLDMSPDELALASKRFEDHGVSLRCERADSMSIDDASVGHILSHLSLMVMSQLDAVVREMARVLIPGGSFAAILPRRGPLEGATAIFHQLFEDAYNSQKTHAPALGDERAWSRDGLTEVLGSANAFGALEFSDIALRLDGTVIEVWNSLSSRYEAYVMLPRDRAEIRKRFAEKVNSLVGADGILPCSVPLLQVTARRTRQ